MYMCESPKGVGWNWVWENKGVKPQTATFQCGAEQPENFQPRPDLPGGFEGTFITVGGQNTFHLIVYSSFNRFVTFTYEP